MFQDAHIHLQDTGTRSADDHGRRRKRSKLGSLPTITGIFGLVIAHKAIEILCGGFGHRAK